MNSFQHLTLVDGVEVNLTSVGISPFLSQDSPVILTQVVGDLTRIFSAAAHIF